MAGGGMGAMPQGDGQQGSIVGMPVGPGMGNPMGGQPGMAGGLGMGGMGFGGGMPQGLGQNIPQGDTFQPQGGMPTMNMQQIGQMLRGLQGVQPQQMPQVAPQYSASPSMQQPLPQQQAMTGSAERNWISQSPYAQQPQQTQQPMVQQPQQGIAGLQNRSQPAKAAMDRYLAMRSRRR